VQRLDRKDPALRGVCASFDLGSGDWTYPAEWIKEWFWEEGRVDDPIGEGTLIFLDEANEALVGFVRWSFRRENVRGKKELMGLIHYIAVAPIYQGKRLADAMFATAEQEAIAYAVDHGKGHADMPFRINVDKGNTRAQKVYERWGFESWKVYTSKTGREYIHMWRPPSEPEQSA
jgi:GNAT superfamily N-acetyltransferase